MEDAVDQLSDGSTSHPFSYISYIDLFYALHQAVSRLVLVWCLDFFLPAYKNVYLQKK